MEVARDITLTFVVIIFGAAFLWLLNGVYQLLRGYGQNIDCATVTKEWMEYNGWMIETNNIYLRAYRLGFFRRFMFGPDKNNPIIFPNIKDVRVAIDHYERTNEYLPQQELSKPSEKELKFKCKWRRVPNYGSFYWLINNWDKCPLLK